MCRHFLTLECAAICTILRPLTGGFFLFLLNSVLFDHYIYVFLHNSSSSEQNPFRSHNSTCVLVAVHFPLFTVRLYFTLTDRFVLLHTSFLYHVLIGCNFFLAFRTFLMPLNAQNLDLSFKIQATDFGVIPDDKNSFPFHTVDR